MTPEERSRALRAEADVVLELVHLRDHCAPIGELAPTGSYFMDLMMYPDIDVYLPPTTPEALLGVAVELSRYQCVQRMNYIRGEPGELADGLYLKPVVTYGNWERPWKIDIWSLPMAVIEHKQAELADLKARMTPAQRGLILHFKRELLNAAGRTPMYSGIFIYKAVIDRGLATLAEVCRFLRDSGVEV